MLRFVLTYALLLLPTAVILISRHSIVPQEILEYNRCMSSSK